MSNAEDDRLTRLGMLSFSREITDDVCKSSLGVLLMATEFRYPLSKIPNMSSHRSMQQWYGISDLAQETSKVHLQAGCRRAQLDQAPAELCMRGELCLDLEACMM